MPLHRWFPNTVTPARDRGSLFVLIAVVICILVLLIGLFFTVQFLFHSKERVQSQADDLCLKLARELNNSDNAGMMNNMVAYSRESVFNSRQTLITISENAEQLRPLAQLLLEDARSGALLVRQEKERLIQSTLANLRRIVNEQQSQKGPELNLPWASYSVPQLRQIELGTIKDVQSNVLSPQGNDALLEDDLQARLVQPRTQLYYAERNLPLSGPDSDITFRLGSLAAPIKNTISPPRLASATVFQRKAYLMKDGKLGGGPGLDTVPSAISVLLVTQVKGMNQSNSETMEAKAAAATVGAGPPPSQK